MPLYTAEIQLRLPCDRSFDEMSPTEGGRYCESCDLTVQDLGALDEYQARALLRRRDEGRVCVAYRPQRDGTVQTAPVRVVPQAALLRKARPAVFAAAALLTACGPVVDALPYAVQEKIPLSVDEALRHPVDFAAWVASPTCQVGRVHAVGGAM